MWVDVDHGGRWRGAPEGGPDGEARLLATVAVAAVALFVASWVPAPFTWLVFAELMRWAAIAAALAALVRGDALTPPYPTGWDQAAAFALLAQLARWQVEPAAVREAVAALETAAGAG